MDLQNFMGGGGNQGISRKEDFWWIGRIHFSSLNPNVAFPQKGFFSMLPKHSLWIGAKPFMVPNVTSYNTAFHIQSIFSYSTSKIFNTFFSVTYTLIISLFGFLFLASATWSTRRWERKKIWPPRDRSHSRAKGAWALTTLESNLLLALVHTFYVIECMPSHRVNSPDSWLLIQHT